MLLRARVIWCGLLVVLMAGLVALDAHAKRAKKYSLPPKALIIEEQSLESQGHPGKSLVLWMLSPEKKRSATPPGYPYSGWDFTRGTYYYSGATRVSLVDTKTQRIINTIEVNGDSKEASFDLPYAIRKDAAYRVKDNPKDGEEHKPHILWLRDYNGDGKALEFALFDAVSYALDWTTLIGYSERQRKVIQYPIRMTVDNKGVRSTETSLWYEDLLHIKPETPGYWKYEIDHTGRGGPLTSYDIRYNPDLELFEGTMVVLKTSEEVEAENERELQEIERREKAKSEN